MLRGGDHRKLPVFSCSSVAHHYVLVPVPGLLSRYRKLYVLAQKRLQRFS
jgi:hypothetical protein